MFLARELVVRLPAALESLRAGDITQGHTAALADATGSLPPEAATAVETAVLARAPGQTATQFRSSLRRALQRVSDPITEEDAHPDALTRRRVVFTPQPHGMTELWAFLPADHAAMINTTLDATANTTHHPGGDDRTADQRRADALTDLARHALDRSDNTRATTGPAAGANAGSDGGGGVGDAGWMSPTATDLAPPGSTETAAGGFRLARAHGQRPAIHVTIAASTLMGLDDQPGDLDGYGPITAAMARRIAADPTATWRRLLTDNRGHVLHAATTGYRPTAAIIATVLARDQHCAFPGGRRPARHNDLDHVTAWRHGDHTTTANTASLCRHHHRLKHAGTWTVHRDDTTGTTTWTDHRKRTYNSQPPTLPTTTTGLGTSVTPADNVPKRPTVSGDDSEPPPF